MREPLGNFIDFLGFNSNQWKTIRKVYSNATKVRNDKFDGFLSIFDKVTHMYELHNGKMSMVKNRDLGAFSDWKATGTITVGGQKYYRVSTNEFIELKYTVKVDK